VLDCHTQHLTAAAHRAFDLAQAVFRDNLSSKPSKRASGNRALQSCTDLSLPQFRTAK
jgi:hypothetical protein